MSDLSTANQLNAQEATQIADEQQSVAAPLPAVTNFQKYLDAIEQLAERVAVIEETISHIVPHIGTLGAVLSIADELAGMVDELKGRTTQSSRRTL